MNVEIRIFNRHTLSPTQNIVEKCACFYREGFSSPPWDVYGWNLSPDGAIKEFSLLTSVVIRSGGALIVIGNGNIPAGFSLVSDLGVLTKRRHRIKQFKKLPENLHDPEHYLEKLAKVMAISSGEFERIGYLASIVVGKTYQGRGYARRLIAASLDFLRTNGKQAALAWSVNPVMARILEKAGFRRLPGIGDNGEGIDFMVKGRVWYPTLDIPKQDSKTGFSGKPPAAGHYSFKLKVESSK